MSETIRALQPGQLRQWWPPGGAAFVVLGPSLRVPWVEVEGRSQPMWDVLDGSGRITEVWVEMIESDSELIA